jgi:hypothetical protein
MPLVHVAGWLRARGRRGRPGGPVDPGYGVDEGEPGYPEGPEVEPPDVDVPDPPAGIWPPLTPENPWRPIDPGFGVGRPERPSQGLPPTPPTPPAGGVGGRPPERPQPGEPGGEAPEHLPALPPGTIWPPLPPGVHGHFLALVLIGGGGHGAHYRYVVVDADARPPAGGIGGRPPQRPGPGEPTPH